MRGLFGTMVRNDAMRTADAETILRSLFYNPSKSGEHVDIHRALRTATVFDCVRVLAEGVAQVELHIKKRRKDGGADLAPEHELYWLLHQQPNEWQTSFRFRETLMIHAALAGNFFAYKSRIGPGFPIRALIPFEPGQVTVTRRDDYTLSYSVRAENGEKMEFPGESIWHIRGPSWNSWMGLEVVALAREAIGLAMAAETTQARLHKNSLRSSGLYSVEGTLTEIQHSQLEQWVDDHLDPDKIFRPLILDHAAKFTPTAMTGVDAQHLETRKHQIEEICREFRVMPVMVGHPADMAARAAMEQIFIAHVVHTLMPWYRRLEQDIVTGLMNPRDRQVYFADFNERELMRGDMKAQGEYYSKALGAGGSQGWLTPNDVRLDIGENPIPGGDKLPQPTNLPAPPASSQGQQS